MGKILCAWFGRWICPGEGDLIEYALDGLDQSERERAQKHLKFCGHCREQVREFLLLNASLALNAPQAEPPQGLEESILSHIREKRPSLAPVAGFAPGAVKPGLWPRIWSVAGPVSALLALGLGVEVFRSQTVFENVRQVQSQLRNSLETKIGREENINAFLCGPKLVTVGLNPMGAPALAGEAVDAAPPQGEPAWARLYLTDGGTQAVLFCRNLPASRPGEAYTLWAFSSGEGGAKKICCQFKTASPATEKFWLEMNAPVDLGPKDLCFGVTREKAASGDPEKTGELVLLGKVKP